MASSHSRAKSHRPTLPTHLAGVRVVALFEALKGAVVLAAGFGIFHLIHHDIGEWADNVVYHLHVDPDRRLARAFLRLAEGMTDRRLIGLAIAAVIYSGVRFAEAYGLWYRRIWAEWFAVISGSLYLPWELYEVVVIHRPRPYRWALLLVNLGIVLYMLYIRLKADEERRLADVTEEEEALRQ